MDGSGQACKKADNCAGSSVHGESTRAKPTKPSPPRMSLPGMASCTLPSAVWLLWTRTSVSWMRWQPFRAWSFAQSTNFSLKKHIFQRTRLEQKHGQITSTQVELIPDLQPVQFAARRSCGAQSVPGGNLWQARSHSLLGCHVPRPDSRLTAGCGQLCGEPGQRLVSRLPVLYHCVCWCCAGHLYAICVWGFCRCGAPRCSAPVCCVGKFGHVQLSVVVRASLDRNMQQQIAVTTTAASHRHATSYASAEAKRLLQFCFVPRERPDHQFQHAANALPAQVLHTCGCPWAIGICAGTHPVFFVGFVWLKHVRLSFWCCFASRASCFKYPQPWCRPVVSGKRG